MHQLNVLCAKYRPKCDQRALIWRYRLISYIQPGFYFVLIRILQYQMELAEPLADVAGIQLRQVLRCVEVGEGPRIAAAEARATL